MRESGQTLAQTARRRRLGAAPWPTARPVSPLPRASANRAKSSANHQLGLWRRNDVPGTSLPMQKRRSCIVGRWIGKPGAWRRACWRGRAGGQGAGPPEAHRPVFGATCPALDAQHSGLEHVAHQATRAACRGSDEIAVEHQKRDGWPLDSAAREPRGVFAAIYWPSSRVRSSSRPPRRALPLYCGFGDGHAALGSTLRGHCGQMLRLPLWHGAACGIHL